MTAPETVETQISTASYAECLHEDSYAAEMAELARAQSPADTPEGALERERGLSELYIRYQTKVIADAYSFTKQHEDAENIAQEVFFRMFQNIDTFNDRGEGLAPWLYQITYRLCVNEYRKRQRHPVVHLDADEAQSFTSDKGHVMSTNLENVRVDGGIIARHNATSSPETVVIAQEEFRHRIRKWLENAGQVRSSEKTMVARLSAMALYSLGYQYTEIAEIRGTAKGTVMSGLSRLRTDIEKIESLAS